MNRSNTVSSALIYCCLLKIIRGADGKFNVQVSRMNFSLEFEFKRKDATNRVETLQLLIAHFRVETIYLIRIVSHLLLFGVPVVGCSFNTVDYNC